MLSLIFFNLLLIAYASIGYLLSLFILSFFSKKSLTKSDTHIPSVTLMIAAYNEEQGIAEKLENSLLLDYPRNLLRIIVVSDGSTDGTDKIVKSYQNRGIELFRVEGRVGKTEARNQAVLKMTSEIIVFSDATAIYQEDALLKMVRNFADPSIGMVSGQLKYFDKSEGTTGLATKLYWAYELAIKRAQSRLRTLTGAVGCINAFRRELYYALPANIIEDFTEPLMIVSQNARVVYESEAIAFERTTQNHKQELKMRVRVIRGGMAGFLFALPHLIKSKQYMAIFQLVSHKVMRWLMPVFVLSLFLFTLVGTLYQNNKVVTILFLLQVLFYLMAALGTLLKTKGFLMKIISIPSYFVIVNMASLIALYKTMTTKLESTWETNVY